MFFSTNAKVFYKKDDSYCVKIVECIDIHDDSIFVMAEDSDEKNHKLVSLPRNSEPILKQLLINKVDVSIVDSDKTENGKQLFEWSMTTYQGTNHNEKHTKGIQILWVIYFWRR